MPGARPKYVEIVQDLQAQIDDGRLAPGDALPSETELAERWRVSRNTIKAAILELRKAGRVETVPNKGSFVAEPARPLIITLNLVETDGPDRGLGGGEGAMFEAEARRQGHEVRSTSPEVYVADATKPLMEALGIQPVPEGGPRPQIVCRSQRRFVDGKPNAVQNTYFRLELALRAQELLKSADIAEGTVAYLREHGHVQAGYEDAFDARPPTAEELAFFGLPRDGLAVIEHRRTAYDENGDAFRHTVTVHRPGANKIRFLSGTLPYDVRLGGF